MEVDVSRVVLGTEQLSGIDWGTYDPEILKVVEESYESGIRIIDTAPVYGLGSVEKKLAKSLGSLRHEVTIATKCGLRWKKVDGKRALTYVDNSEDSIVEEVEGSLKRLGLQQIPILMLHRKDKNTHLDESFNCLEKLKDKGLVKYIGVSNHDLEDLKYLSNNKVLDYVSFELNYLYQINIDKLEFCKENNIKVLSYSSLARGMLTEKFLEGFRDYEKEDRRSRLPQFDEENYSMYVEKVNKLKEVSQKADFNIPSAALRWLLDVVGCDFSIVGFRNLKQFESIKKAINNQLPESIISELKEI